MFDYMIKGYPWEEGDGAIKKKHCSALGRLIREEIAQKAVKGESSEVPDYVLNLWHNLVVQVEHIEVDWDCMNLDAFEDGGYQNYGYKSFAPLFCNEAVTAPDFAAFTKLLPNVGTLSVYDDANFRKSIALGPSVVTNLLESLRTHSTIKKIDIVNPRCDVMEFVAEHKE